MKSRSATSATSPSTFRNLGLCVLATLALGASIAQADNSSCLLGRSSGNVAAQPMAAAPTPQFQEQMRLIEQGLREGRVTPYEAGRLMRQQWDMEQFRNQFRQGFLTPTPGASSTPSPAVSPTTRNEGCGLGSLLGNTTGGDLGASLGDMAKNGMQTAGSLMRSLMREGERLLREQPEAPMEPL